MRYHQGRSAYGIQLPPMAVQKGNSFMHTQATWCCCSMISAVLSIVFELIAVRKVRELASLTPSLPAEERKHWDQLSQFHFENTWIYGVSYLVTACLLGGVVYCCSKHLLETGNVKICCCVDYCCGVTYGIASCWACFLMGILITVAAGLSDPAAVCRAANAEEVLAPGVAIIPTSTLGNPTDPSFVNCESAVNVLRDLAYVMTFNMLLVSIIWCFQMVTCCAGGKLASDTQDVLDGSLGVETGDYYSGTGQYY